MKKQINKITCILLLLIITTATNVTATSWVEMEHEDVYERSELVVKGIYDFSSTSEPSQNIFQGYKFEVNEILKGDSTKAIIAGIDANDIGWVKSFQEEGGEFLLLLEQSEVADFLTPVGGPNGMIQVKDGEVYQPEQKEFYQEILDMQPRLIQSENEPVQESEEKSGNFSIYYIGLGLVLLLAVVAHFKSRRK